MKSSCNKLYELLYEALFLRHPSKVDKHFANLLDETKKCLVDKENIQKNVLHCRKKNNLVDEVVDVCLAIDACSFYRLASKIKKYAFSVRFIEPILKLGKAISDSSSTSKMRDSYVKELFNITSLMKLVNEGEAEASAYFLPYCCWAEAIFNEALDFESRYYLLSVVFYSFHSFYIQSLQKRCGNIYERNT